jgi:hypothetical protein
LRVDSVVASKRFKVTKIHAVHVDISWVRVSCNAILLSYNEGKPYIDYVITCLRYAFVSHRIGSRIC